MPRGGAREGAGRKAGWSERGEKGGRPKGSTKDGTGRKTIYKNFTVSCLPEEYEVLKRKAQESGKTISRFLIDSVK